MFTEPRDSLFDFRAFVRVSNPNFPRFFFFEFQVVRTSNRSKFEDSLYNVPSSQTFRSYIKFNNTILYITVFGAWHYVWSKISMVWLMLIHCPCFWPVRSQQKAQWVLWTSRSEVTVSRCARDIAGCWLHCLTSPPTEGKQWALNSHLNKHSDGAVFSHIKQSKTVPVTGHGGP
jgi:hypothetical protein